MGLVVIKGSEGSAFLRLLGKMQIPRANPALGMTVLEFFRSLSKLSDFPKSGSPRPAEGGSEKPYHLVMRELQRSLMIRPKLPGQNHVEGLYRGGGAT